MAPSEGGASLAPAVRVGGDARAPRGALARVLQPPARVMNGLMQRFSTSGVGRFWAKFMSDFSTYGAVLIAWQSLFSLFPLIVGFLAIFSLVLQDPSQRRALAVNVAQQFPSQVTDLLGFMEETRQLGGLLGLISAAGLIWSGFWLFDTMAFVFNRFYRVPDRSYLAEMVMALTMMAVYVVLITVSAR